MVLTPIVCAMRFKRCPISRRVLNTLTPASLKTQYRLLVTVYAIHTLSRRMIARIIGLHRGPLISMASVVSRVSMQYCYLPLVNHASSYLERQNNLLQLPNVQISSLIIYTWPCIFCGELYKQFQVTTL